MHQQAIRVTVAGFFDSRAGAGGGDFQLVAGIFLEIGLQVGQQAGVVD